MTVSEILIQSPHIGPVFIDYKGTFNVVLMAFVDANYNFIFVNPGYQNRISDGGMFFFKYHFTE
jgi:hypothetical protein